MGSYAQMVCDNEIAASVRRLLNGFSVDEDSLAVAVIDKVMAGPRNFLAEQHTIDYLRADEILFPKNAERRMFAEWDRSGRRGFAEKAQAEAEQILAEHEVPPLEDVQEKEIEKIMRTAINALVH